MRLVRWTPDDLVRRLDDVVAVYGEAMGYRTDLLEARRGYIATHVRRPGFRAVASLTSEGHLAGFGYGYLGASGQWWHDQVHRALDAPTRTRWLTHCFEVVELHVRPTGAGARPGRRSAARAARHGGGRHHAAVHPGGRRADLAGLAVVPTVRLRRRAARLPLPRRRAAVRRARSGSAARAHRRHDPADLLDTARRPGARPDLLPAHHRRHPGRAHRGHRRPRLAALGRPRAAQPGSTGGGGAGRGGHRRRVRDRGDRGGHRLAVRQLRLLRRAGPQAGRGATDHSAGLDLDGLAGVAGRGPTDRPAAARGSRRQRADGGSMGGADRAGHGGAGRLGPLPRPADGGRGLLGLARRHPGVARPGRHPGQQLPGLAALRGADDERAAPAGRAGRRAHRSAGPPDGRALPVDVLLQHPGPRRLPRPARLGALGRRRHVGDRRTAGGDPAPRPAQPSPPAGGPPATPPPASTRPDDRPARPADRRRRVDRAHLAQRRPLAAPAQRPARRRRRTGGRAAAAARRGRPGSRPACARCSPSAAYPGCASWSSTTGPPTAPPTWSARWPATTPGHAAHRGRPAAGLAGQAARLLAAGHPGRPGRHRAGLRRRRRGARPARRGRGRHRAARRPARRCCRRTPGSWWRRRPTGWCSRCCSGSG